MTCAAADVGEDEDNDMEMVPLKLLAAVRIGTCFWKCTDSGVS